MKSLTICILTFLICITSIGQINKPIIVTKSPKIVPTGKKWILQSGIKTRVQVSYGVLNSGSFCNAIFRSTPRIISSVNRGNTFNAESYVLIFQEPEKVPYTNDYTYDLIIISIADKNFSIDDLQQKSPDEVGTNKIEFKGGESVFVGNCLESIELQEINMTQTELLEIKKKNDEINKANQLILSNFNIPVNPEKYVESGTKPEIHDSKLKSIIFSSSAVIFKRPSKVPALDDVSTWTLTLSADKFTLQSSNGIDKKYTVIKIEYDEQMKMQKFTLGNSDKEITHNLLISWSNNRYTLILNSTDNTEEYQFQEVQSTDKQYQPK
jgi:hypothetical protein